MSKHLVFSVLLCSPVETERPSVWIRGHSFSCFTFQSSAPLFPPIYSQIMLWWEATATMLINCGSRLKWTLMGDHISLVITVWEFHSNQSSASQDILLTNDANLWILEVSVKIFNREPVWWGWCSATTPAHYNSVSVKLAQSRWLSGGGHH